MQQAINETAQHVAKAKVDPQVIRDSVLGAMTLEVLEATGEVELPREAGEE
jgi:hypothetical protein